MRDQGERTTFPHGADSKEIVGECPCGLLVVKLPLPDDLAALSGKDFLLSHDNGEMQCYPYSDNPEDRKATAEVL